MVVLPAGVNVASPQPSPMFSRCHPDRRSAACPAAIVRPVVLHHITHSANTRVPDHTPMRMSSRGRTPETAAHTGEIAMNTGCDTRRNGHFSDVVGGHVHRAW